MKRAMWGLLGVLALLWSLFGWMLHALAGSGSAAVVTLTRWLDLEPASTQWVADGLGLAGDVAQWLVVLVWLLGMAVLGLVGWFSARAAVLADDVTKQVSRMAVTNDRVHSGPIIEGQAHDKTLS